MEALAPVVIGLEPYEIVLGADQPEYLPLHVLRSPGPSYPVMSRWGLSDEERKQIAEGADVYLTLWTFGNRYPPTTLHVMRPDADPEQLKELMSLDEELDQRLGALLAAEQIRIQHEEKQREKVPESDSGSHGK